MTKYTIQQRVKAHCLVRGDLGPADVEKIIDYLRTDAKADIEAGLWDEPLDPIEQARRDAQEIVAQYWEAHGDIIEAARIREGNFLCSSFFEVAFAALCHERGLNMPS